MDRLRQLEIFVTVADLGSFSGAAERMELPRSTVSGAIQALETRLQTRLIQRTTRRMRLTADGEACLDWCRRLLAEIEETESVFRKSGSQPSGRLRVDVPTRMASLLIAPALPGFFVQYPEIELELLATDRPVDLQQEGVDCALRVGAVRDPSLVAQPLCLLEQGNYASPAYLQRHGVPMAPTDLGSHLAVHYVLPSTGRIDAWEYDDGGVARTVAMRGMVLANSADTYIACCIAGLGLIQIPRYDARRHIASGELVEVMPSHRPGPLQAWLLYPHRHRLSRRVQAFSGWVQRLVAEQAIGG
ncbi:LysR family transcriptional regulator [Luteimonas aestuarii]|uniref:LysR family transcriptional regulator n=1 Tax=Luteimonas aestuarii TaxID=453837 RepID=A0A4R5TY99_9GAMM|nr:LysR family transcriptional regulator [Luteimonas aestuarii]TDK26131.1 LysR family transcriptional regulator [Luteimonas aestuarii]